MFGKTGRGRQSSSAGAKSTRRLMNETTHTANMELMWGIGNEVIKNSLLCRLGMCKGSFQALFSF